MTRISPVACVQVKVREMPEVGWNKKLGKLVRQIKYFLRNTVCPK